METEKRKGGSGEGEESERFFITKKQLRIVKEVLKSVEGYAQTPLMKNFIEEATEITKNIELNAMQDLVLRAVLTKYLRRNNFDDLLAIIAGLAREQGQHFTFYRAR